MGVGESDGGRGSKGGRVSNGGMREWCGVVEEEPWSLLTWARRRPCPFMGAGRHARWFSFVGTRCSFVDGRLRSWQSSWGVLAVNGGSCRRLWALDVRR